MSAWTLPVAIAIAEKFPWRDNGELIDIGTAEGCMPVVIAKAHPHLVGSGFDLRSFSRCSRAT
jgi:hypothetical protein